LVWFLCFCGKFQRFNTNFNLFLTAGLNVSAFVGSFILYNFIYIDEWEYTQYLNMSLKIYSSSIAIPPGYTLGNDIQMFSRNQSIFFISGAPPSVKKNAGNLIDIKDIQPTGKLFL
jgi:hypothetical protein